MKYKQYYIISFAFLVWMFPSCRKEHIQKASIPVSMDEVLTGFASKVVYANYCDFELKAAELQTNILALKSSNSASNLSVCKQSWIAARAVWEQNGAYIFGPIATEDYANSMNAWPLNKGELGKILGSNQTFTAGYLDSTQHSLKGFHALEYLLFGEQGAKTIADFNARELDYLLALGDELHLKSMTIKTSWDPANQTSYYYNYTSAGLSGSSYVSKLAAIIELVNSMIGCCEEVAEVKIGAPLSTQDINYIESPYSQNSIADFQNNLRGVQHAYRGFYKDDTVGLTDWINQKNSSLDLKIQQKMNVAINSFAVLTLPFGEGIISQQIQLQQVQISILELKNILEDELLPFVQAHIQE